MIKIGIIGAGRLARIAVLPALKQIDNIELSGIYNRTFEKAQKLARDFQIPFCYKDLDKFLSQKYGAVLVLSSPEVHKIHVISALQAGSHVFCEKPLSASLNEVEEMVAISQKTNKKLMVGFNRRYSPFFSKAKEIFANIQVELCSVAKHKDSLMKRGLLIDAIHYVDLMRWFCGGKVNYVSAVAEYEDPWKEKTLTATMKFSTGAIGTLLMNRSSGQWLEISEFHGGKKSVIIDYPKKIEVITSCKKEYFDFKTKDWSWAINMPWLTGFVQQFEHFFRCIELGEEVLTSGSDALLTHQLVHQVYISAGLPGLED